MHRGSCLCGTIRYEIRGELGPITLCHCAQCRKAQGTAFAAVAPVRVADFTVVAGRDALTEYESSPGKRRAFCSRCGSPIYSRRDTLPDALRLRIGLLDTPIDAKPVAHIFATSRAEWDEIHDDLPQYAGTEPGRPTRN
jgi:hypothetical protein